MKVNTPAGWQDCTPTKINTPAGWATVQKVKMAVDGVWKDVYPTEEPFVLTNVTWRKTGNPYEIEFTAVGGSNSYFWDWDGPTATTEGGGYGQKVMIHKYKSSGSKTVTCTDYGDDPQQQGVVVTITVTA